MYTIYDIRINRNTKNWNGCEWVVDGEAGIMTFPATMTEEEVRKQYQIEARRYAR